MPVDFSMVGLEGIKAGQDTLTAIEARKQMSTVTRGQEIENFTTERDIALGNEAAAKLAQIASGKSSQESHLFDDVKVDDSEARILEITGDTFIRGGSPKQGTEYLKAAAEIRKKEQEMDSAKLTDAQNKLENVAKISDLVSKSIGVARNESEWRWGLQQLRDAEVLPAEQLDKLAEMDYDPDVVSYLNEQAISAFQRASLGLTAAEKDYRRNLDERKFMNTQEQTSIAQERLRLAKIAQDRVGRQGTSSSTPTAVETGQAEATIKNAIFKGEVPKGAEAALKAGAVTIASRAKQLIRADKSLDWETALNRSILESESNGDWKIEATEEVNAVAGFFGAKGKKAKASFNNIRPLPVTKEGKPNPKAFRKGQVYITAQGKAEWDGTGLVPIE